MKQTPNIRDKFCQGGETGISCRFAVDLPLHVHYTSCPEKELSLGTIQQDLLMDVFSLISFKRILNFIKHRAVMEPRPPSLPEAIALGRFNYHRIGYDRRCMELLAGGVIGRGRAGLERWWRIDEQGCLLIGGHSGPSCRLLLGSDGVWRGRWLKFERMDIELIPSADEETPSMGSIIAREPIDAVYTWVNGDDPQFQAALKRYRPRTWGVRDGSPTALCRFRDNDELKYSLRSLDRFAPFIRNVYLVTNGQVPRWINQNHPRLRLVRHEEIFPSSAQLPTFNSPAIEMQLHRIPTLSSRFLYFNDDFFLGAPLSPGELLPESGVQCVLTDEPPSRAIVRGRSMFERRIKHTLSLIENELGPIPRWTSLPHTPRLFDRERIEEVQNRFRDAIAETSARRFRTADCLVWHLLYMNYVVLAPHLRTRTEVRRLTRNDDYMFVMLSPSLETMREKLEDVKVQRPKYICFNDDLDESARAKRSLAELRMFYDAYYPEPSRFEAG